MSELHIGTHDGQSVHWHRHPFTCYRAPSRSPPTHTHTTAFLFSIVRCALRSFHCDEALACFLLRQLPAYRSATVVRSRDPAVLSALPIIVDVGAVYDPATHRYDHHQRGFTETFSPDHPIKLSSAGLIYKHFGRAVITALTGCVDEGELDVMHLRLYRTFIEAIDAIDNGVAQYDAAVKPLYRINTDLSSRVGHLNGGAWDSRPDETQDERFERASQLAGKEFVDALMFLHRQWLPARRVVQRMLAGRFDVHPSGAIVRMDEFVVWKAHLAALEKEAAVAERVLYVLYKDERGKWRVQAVPEDEQSFESRKPLPEAWRGIRDDALSALTGIPGCIFVHAAGFIGGAETYEAALAMAVASWEFPNPAKKLRIEESKA